MQDELKYWAVKKESAICYVDNANRWLNLGEALNWIPQEISTAVYWSLEGWLNQCKIAPDFGNGWNSMFHQFYKLAPETLRSDASYILSEATFLEIELLGDPSGLETRPEERTLDLWKSKVDDLLLKAKQFIKNLEKDLLARIDLSPKVNKEVIPE